MKHSELTNEYLSALCMELSMLIQAGIAPYDCVITLLDEQCGQDEKTVLNSLLPKLETGFPLSAAFRDSEYFPPYMVIMTEAGEKTGRTSEALKALSAHYDGQERLYSAIRDAILYPSILFVLMVVVALVLIVRVLPVFSGVFRQMGTQMPPLAANLMFFGEWLARFFGVFAAAAVAVIIAAFAAWRIPSARRAIGGAFRNVFGGFGVLRKITAARVVSVMALATASGIGPEEAMELAVSVGEGAEPVQKMRGAFLDALTAGSTLSDAMLKAGVLTARNSRLLAVGARGGMTDTALAEISARCEREAQNELNRLVGIIEPSLVIISSALVGAILLMVMLPLVSVMSSIG